MGIAPRSWATRSCCFFSFRCFGTCKKCFGALEEVLVSLGVWRELLGGDCAATNVVPTTFHVFLALRAQIISALLHFPARLKLKTPYPSNWAYKLPTMMNVLL